MNYDDVKLASISKRAWAYFIDEMIMSFLFLVAFYDKIINSTSPEETMEIILPGAVIYLVVAKILYQVVFIYLYGATLGKMVLKIKCISYDGSNPNISSSFIRGVAKIIISSELSFYIGYIWAFFDPVKKTWHDGLAKTLVIDVS